MASTRKFRNITTQLFSNETSAPVQKVSKPSAWAKPVEHSFDTVDAALQSLAPVLPNRQTTLEVCQQYLADLDRSLANLTLIHENTTDPTMQNVGGGIAPKNVRTAPAPGRVPSKDAKDSLAGSSPSAEESTTPSAPGNGHASSSVKKNEWTKVRAPKKAATTKPVAGSIPHKKAADTGMALRLRAREKLEESQRHFSAAASLHDKGRWAEASAARAEAKALHEQYLALNQHAEATVFAEKNPDMDASLAIDLHLLSWAEAEARLQTHLPVLTAAARRRRVRTVKVVVGAGNHSVGGQPVLGPRVERWLRDRGVPARETPGLTGVLAVRADAVWN
jgi:DNA-nicking Smr family endonuclease